MCLVSAQSLYRLPNSCTCIQVGLLYDEESLRGALDITRDWTNKDRDYLRQQVMVGYRNLSNVTAACCNLMSIPTSREKMFTFINLAAHRRFLVVDFGQNATKLV